MKCRILSVDTAWLSDILLDRIPVEEIGNVPSKSSAILAYLKSFQPGVKYDYGSWEDPLPIFSDFLLSLLAFFLGISLPFKVRLKPFDH